MTDDIRGQIILRLQELATKPRKSRTQLELQEARDLLEVLRTKQEIIEFPKRSFFQSVKLNFDLAKLNEEIDDFADPKRSYLKSLRQDYEIKELKHKMRALDGPSRPIPFKAIFIGVAAIGVFLLLAAIINAPPEIQQQWVEFISWPVGIGILALMFWPKKKL